jgi:hypothetical protein
MHEVWHIHNNINDSSYFVAIANASISIVNHLSNSYVMVSPTAPIITRYNIQRTLYPAKVSSLVQAGSKVWLAAMIRKPENLLCTNLRSTWTFNVDL